MKGIVSRNNDEVDGIPRHVLDIRRLVGDEDGDGRAASDRPLKLSSGQCAAGAGEYNLHVLRKESSDDADEDHPKKEVEIVGPKSVEVVGPRKSTRVRGPLVWLEEYEW